MSGPNGCWQVSAPILSFPAYQETMQRDRRNTPYLESAWRVPRQAVSRAILPRLFLHLSNPIPKAGCLFSLTAGTVVFRPPPVFAILSHTCRTC